jgi:hypothetical protein
MSRIIIATVAIVAAFATVSFAEEITFTGPITKVELQGASAKVTVKDKKSGKDNVVIVKDQLTLDKLSDKRIAGDDEVRVKYESTTGVTKLMRKTAGC